MSKDALIVGVLDTSEEIGDRDLAAKCRDFTISCCRFDYFGPILEGDSVDGILEQASHGDHAYCLIQGYGHAMVRYRDAERSIVTNFIKAVGEWAAEHDFLVAGRILDGGERWYGLDPFCLLVDLRHYRDLGKPSFHDDGGPRPLPAAEARREARNGESVLHALRPAVGDTASNTAGDPQLPGWSLIAASLQHGKEVRDFDPLLYRCRYDLRLDEPAARKTARAFLGEGIFAYDSDEADGLPAGWRGFLDFVKDQAKYAKQGIFLGNWESYDDIETPPEGFRGPVSSLYGVAAGFKPNRMLATHGFDETTRVVFFDYSSAALAMRRALVEEWDGVDFPRFIASVAERFPDAFYQLWGNAQPGTLDLDLVAGIWDKEVKSWGGGAAFQEHWARYRALPHRFVQCDLFADPRPLLATLESGPGAVMWWSNAFHSLNSVWFYTLEERQRRYRQWLRDAAAINPGMLLYGTDVDNLNIGGTFIRDHL